MKIENTNNTQTIEASQRQNNKTVQKSTPETEKNKTTDSVDLSIEAASKSLKLLPISNVERVAELKIAIENGSYTIDNEKLANNIIASEKELSNTG
jgi:negative regulator of flagellin synthesis FlgM